MLEIHPITFKDACAYIREHHRHHKPPTGWMFGCSVRSDAEIVGVAMVGRPVARMIQNREPYTLEVNRLCTNGTPHVASKLYAACWRAARALGYRRLITYILESESGTSLRASGWQEVGVRGGGSWSAPSRPRGDHHPLERKTLWEVRA